MAPLQCAAVAASRRAIFVLLLGGVIAAQAIAHGDASSPEARTPDAAAARRPSPTLVVVVPIVDVRAHPTVSGPADIHDPDQETQLLYGEHVRVLEQRNGWARIEAPEQPEFSHHHYWEGYPGWVPLAALQAETDTRPPTLVVTVTWAAINAAPRPNAPVLVTVAMGTWLDGGDLHEDWWCIYLPDGRAGWIHRDEASPLAAIASAPPMQQRRQVLTSAQRLLDTPYRWGGRSPERAESAVPPAGVDCSGLVQLAYRTIGRSIPRDAHEQALRSRRLQRDQLQPGDLVFLSAAQEPQQIVHVLLYAGDGRLIEGPGTGSRVRQIAWVERFGQPFSRTEARQTINGQTISFGAYLP